MRRTIASFFLICAIIPPVSATVHAVEPDQILISVADQKLRVIRGGHTIADFAVSTSKFGVGDGFGTYRTPLGEMMISSKIGEHLQSGAVLKGRRPTGEVLPPNAPGRDPIVTRILCLRGLEDANRHAEARGIYIHGTPEERRVGKPVSFGCIRMRSKDVIALFNHVGVGTRVIIRQESLRKMTRELAKRIKPGDSPITTVQRMGEPESSDGSSS